MTSTAIRNAVIDDARPVGELITTLGYPTTTEAMRDRLAIILKDPNSVTLVAVTDRDVVEICRTRPEKSRNHSSTAKEEW